jgi:hypothetical protein
MTITETGNVRHGIDLDAFEAFCEFAAEHPADVQLEFEAVGEYEGRAVHTTASTGPYSLGGQRIDRMARRYVHHFGAHKEVEAAVGFVEPTDREEVVEVVLAALTACINAVVSTSALARGIVIDGLTTSVSIGWDPFVFLHLREPARAGAGVDQFGSLQVELEVTGDRLTDDDLDYLRWSVERSAVFNLITLAHPASPSVRRGQ